MILPSLLPLLPRAHSHVRCVASCVAACAAVAFMLQRQPRHLKEDGEYDTSAISQECFDLATPCLAGENAVSFKPISNQ